MDERLLVIFTSCVDLILDLVDYFLDLTDGRVERVNNIITTES
jgi:hypothetical protein